MGLGAELVGVNPGNVLSHSREAFTTKNQSGV